MSDTKISYHSNFSFGNINGRLYVDCNDVVNALLLIAALGTEENNIRILIETLMAGYELEKGQSATH